MHVAFLSFCPTVGGITTYQANQIRFLLDTQAPTAAQAMTLLDEFPETTLGRLPPGLRPRVQVVRTPLWSDAAEAAPALRAWLVAATPGVLSISNPGLLVRHARFVTAARRRGWRVALTQHSEILTPTPRRMLMAGGAALLSPILAETVYVSAHTRRWWRRRFPWLRLLPQRVVVNGLPLEAPVVGPRNPARPLRVGFVGRLELEKGIDLFCDLAAAARARGDFPFEFHAFGSGSWTARPGAASVPVEWHGQAADAAAIYGLVDLLLVCSPVENCPYAVLEAKDWGVPTVSARVGGMPEIVIDGRDGVLARERTVGALLDALAVAARDYTTLSAGCLARRGDFDLRKRGREMWAPYGMRA